MPSWRSSAAYRIAFINFGAYALGLALLGAVVFAVMHGAFARQLDAMVSDEAQVLADQYASDGNRELAEAIAQREASTSATRMLYAVFTPDGRRIFGTLQTTRPALGIHPISFVDPGEGPDTARARVIDLSPNERLVVAVDSEWVERIERTIIIIFAIAFAGACLVGFGGAVILGAYLQRRLRSISRSAEAIIGGDTRKRMPVSPREDEFDQLAATLNRMLDRVEGLLENLRQVSSDVAHDLRTPLARLRARLERGAVEGGDAAAVIEDAIGQVDHVLTLFAAILRIAEVESGETRRYFEPVNISALVTELAESFAPSIEDEGRTLLWSIEPGLMVEGDRELLAQAFINLIENAQRHTPAGTVIRLTLVLANDRVCVHVADNGPGVPKSELDRVTRRFARLESSRNTAGYGLGLSLVSAVAKLHRGRLVLKRTEPGLSATIDLPAAASPHSQPTDHKSKEPAE
jgi:signal transduction histidine kinase